MFKSVFLIFLFIIPFAEDYLICQKHFDTIAFEFSRPFDTVDYSNEGNAKFIQQGLENLRNRSGSGENLHASTHYYMRKGYIRYYQSNFKQAAMFFDSAGYYAVKNEDSSMQFKTHMNAGALYQLSGNYTKALINYLNGVKIAEVVYPSATPGLYTNIGMLYNDVDMLIKAEEYLQKSIDLFEKHGSPKSELVKPLNVLGMISKKRENIEKSEFLFLEAKELAENSGAYRDLGDILTNLAEIANYKGDSQKEFNYLNESVEAYKKSGFKESYYGAMFQLAKYHFDNNKNDEPLKILKKIMNELHTFSFNYVSYYEFYKLYAQVLNKKGEHKKAYELSELAMKYRDSLVNEAILDEADKMEIKFSMEQSKKIDSIQRAEEVQRNQLIFQRKEAEKEAELSQQKFISSLGIGGGVIAVLIALTLYRSNKIKTKKNEVIKAQKDEIELKQTEIVDSILYAKRLQQAVLPPKKYFDKWLPKNMIVYFPKDIIAGDFYFMDVIKENGKTLIFYAVADCTGHGVPGAMVSVLGANGLKRCIQEFGLRAPGEILDKLSELIAENFSKSEEEIRDGMDISLCCLELEEEDVTKIHYAGANNPLWVINPSRKTIPESATPFKEGGGFEIKANKQAIGYSESLLAFNTHSFSIEKGDTIYMFSDGFSDQFGGADSNPSGKKYKSANFRKLLINMYDKNMEEQKELISKEFEEWKGELEQVDDVCVIGVSLLDSATL